MSPPYYVFGNLSVLSIYSEVLILCDPNIFYQGTNFINVKLNFQVPQFYQLVFEMELQSKSPLTILIPMIILLNSSLTLKIIQTRNWSLWTTSGNLENGSRKFPNVFSRGKERAYLVEIKVVLPQVNISVSWVMKFITYFILWIDIMKGQKVIFFTLWVKPSLSSH